LVALGLACRKQTAGASPEGASTAAPVASVASAASAPTADAGAKATEPASKPFACGDVLFVLGREWVEERTSSATSTGSGGVVGQVWRGAMKKERRLQKKILAMRGDAITRMRITFLVDRDADADAVTLHGRSFIVASAAPPDAVRVEDDNGTELDAPTATPVAAVAPEMMSPRWLGDTHALAERLRVALRWYVHDPRTTEGPDAGQPWGAATLSPTPTPARKTPHRDAQAFTVTGNASDVFVGMGHFAEFRIRVSGSIIASTDGALLESQLLTRSTVSERVNICGPRQLGPCPLSTTATTTTVESFRLQCSAP